ncbi:hypothetical protein DA075_34235 [Methylobacterium currus]|uniref:Uncharacterized protein n=1 Tax=Methylobacterium currus TaxID=2051553 RepID=A0A2R4WWG9_9HYPH|nr:hypothetical protein [Methylobacterium currus]AWB25883.1 hypothetical protein DA075_34235 [Methylobacterium currus]
MVGWALDTRDPRNKIMVEAFSSAGESAQTLADSFRKDLLDAGIGDGYHGFQISVAGWRGDLSTISVRRADTGEILGRAPLPVLRPTAQDDAASSRWIGYVDYVDESAVVGWALDRELPNLPVAIEVCTETGLRTTGLADIYRQDVERLGYGNGRHGFHIELPRLGQRSRITVNFASSGVSLTEQPIDVHPEAALLTGRVPSAFRRAMERAAFEIDARSKELNGSRTGA